MKKPILIAAIVIVLLGLVVPAAILTVKAYSGIPTFSIISVVPDTSVTIQTDNFPANYTFNVLMGPIGSAGIGGTQVDSTNSGAGGAFQATYNIPTALQGSALIAIRLQSTTGGFFAYNWFANAASVSPTPTGSDTGSATATPAATATTGYTGYPTFSVTSVVADSSAAIDIVNLPANTTFNVFMGAFGTAGIGGTQVGSFDSGAGGEMTATYNVPDGLKGAVQLAIRIQSTTGGYFAYNWFWNSTGTAATATPAPTATATGGTGGPVYAGFPIFTITSVVKDTSVTISATNFPVNYDFVVLMGAYGTAGIGGTQVATFNSGAGGDFSATYNIPTALQGSTRIAIRIQSTTGGFFSYNWFWNN